jgi:hypothetical protein
MSSTSSSPQASSPGKAVTPEPSSGAPFLVIAANALAKSVITRLVPITRQSNSRIKK